MGGLIEKFEAVSSRCQCGHPDIEIVRQYITAAPDFDGFVAPDRGREIALSMYEDNGADIIYHAAGLSAPASSMRPRSSARLRAPCGPSVSTDQYNTAGDE